jgi:hypothetical protein
MLRPFSATNAVVTQARFAAAQAADFRSIAGGKNFFAVLLCSTE